MSVNRNRRMKCPNCRVCLRELDKGTDTHRMQCPECVHNFPLRGRNTKRIQEFYTWLSVDEIGKEGMIAFMRNGVFTVAQHSERDMALKLEPLFMPDLLANKMTARLVRYERAEDVLYVKGV